MNIAVIGGTRGIGIEIVNILAQSADNKILVTGRNESVLKKLEAQYLNITTLPIDLAVFDTHSESFIKSVKKSLKKVDILINVAGMLISKEFLNTSNSEARIMMETNFFGPASVMRAIKPLMSPGSHIVNISSMGGFQGSSKYAGLSYYSASKAALTCLTECLAVEFRESGVYVNCLALGSVQTEMLETAFPGYKAPVNAKDMAAFITHFALTGHKFFNGKILPVALSNP
jgi:short-subunit dehydrogenase